MTFPVHAAARFDDAPDLPAELIVNGYPVSSKTVTADGSLSEISFETSFQESQWVAIRVFPHGHTNPIHVVVDGKPQRPSRESARWCLAGVEQCWKSKQNSYASEEQAHAQAAYEHARCTYTELIQLSEQ